MKTEPKVRPSQILKVLSYRVAVKVLAKALLDLADTGKISNANRIFLEEVSRGRK